MLKNVGDGYLACPEARCKLYDKSIKVKRLDRLEQAVALLNDRLLDLTRLGNYNLPHDQVNVGTFIECDNCSSTLVRHEIKIDPDSEPYVPKTTEELLAEIEAQVAEIRKKYEQATPQDG